MPTPRSRRKTTPKPRPLKVGTLVYLRNVGFPFDRTDDGHESWEGASCEVVKGSAQPGSVAHAMKMICVRPLLPIKAGYDRAGPEDAHFDPEQVVRETRPWLRKHLKALLRVRKSLLTLRETIVDHLS